MSLLPPVAGAGTADRNFGSFSRLGGLARDEPVQNNVEQLVANFSWGRPLALVQPRQAVERAEQDDKNILLVTWP